MKPSEVLRLARALVEQPGSWCRTYAQRRGHTALTAITTIVKTTGSKSWAAATYLRRVISNPVISEWNDHPARTHDHVLKAFDDAIALAEREGE